MLWLRGPLRHPRSRLIMLGDKHARTARPRGAGPVIVTRMAALCLGLALLAVAPGRGNAQDPTEIAFWSMVKESQKAADIKAYLEAYPRGTYAEAARQRLSELERMPPPPRPPPPSRPVAGARLADAARAILALAVRGDTGPDRRIGDPRGAGAALQPELRRRRHQRPADGRDPQRDPPMAEQHAAAAEGRHGPRGPHPVAQHPPAHDLGGDRLRRARRQRGRVEPRIATGCRRRRPQRLPRSQQGRRVQGPVCSRKRLRCARLLHGRRVVGRLRHQYGRRWDRRRRWRWISAASRRGGPMRAGCASPSAPTAATSNRARGRRGDGETGGDAALRHTLAAAAVRGGARCRRAARPARRRCRGPDSTIWRRASSAMAWARPASR